MFTQQWTFFIIIKEDRNMGTLDNLSKEDYEKLKKEMLEQMKEK